MNNTIIGLFCLLIGILIGINIPSNSDLHLTHSYIKDGGYKSELLVFDDKDKALVYAKSLIDTRTVEVHLEDKNKVYFNYKGINLEEIFYKAQESYKDNPNSSFWNHLDSIWNK